MIKAPDPFKPEHANGLRMKAQSIPYLRANKTWVKPL